MVKQNPISRVWDIIEKASVGMLTTRFADGLRARPLEPRPDRDEGVIYFLTDVRGAKDDEIEAAPEVAFIIVDHDDKAYLSISAKAEVLRDDDPHVGRFVQPEERQGLARPSGRPTGSARR